MLNSVTRLDFYKWERGDMDGYADTLESAMYLLRYVDNPDAAEWVDEQMAVLYGYQREDGAVTDENIDGNFIRTVMLYGRWLTRGAGWSRGARPSRWAQRKTAPACRSTCVPRRHGPGGWSSTRPGTARCCASTRTIRD